MSYRFPSIEDLVARNKANIEGRLNKKTPPADEAFNTVIAVLEAMIAKSIYAYAADRVAANYARTAQGVDLDLIGSRWECTRKQATAFNCSASLVADDGVTIDIGTNFSGPQGLVYQTTTIETAPISTPGSGVVLNLECIDAGIAGNISIGDELTIQSPVAFAARKAVVASIVALGTESEIDEDYKIRILDVQRAEDGSGNSSCLRKWAQAVIGVKRAYPFSGPPVTSSETPVPVMRTVYIESTSDISVDRVPTQAVLDAVKAALLSDPDTGISREILGFTEDTLYVEPIVRTAIYIKITGMKVTIGTEAAAQTAITEALTDFMETFRPFVQGLDPDFERSDTITAQYIGREIQNILDAYGGTTQSVAFGTVVGTYLGEYSLDDNEIPQIATITWEPVS